LAAPPPCAALDKNSWSRHIRGVALPRVQPIIPTWRKEPFDDPDWLFDFKYDRFRGLCYIEQGRCRVISRNGNVLGRFEVLGDQVVRLLEVNEAAMRHLGATVIGQSAAGARRVGQAHPPVRRAELGPPLPPRPDGNPQPPWRPGGWVCLGSIRRVKLERGVFRAHRDSWWWGRSAAQSEARS